MNLSHSREFLESKGYQGTGITTPDLPGYGLICKTLIKLDLAHGSITAFRLDSGGWELFRTPEATPGFKDLPLLPK